MFILGLFKPDWPAGVCRYFLRDCHMNKSDVVFVENVETVTQPRTQGLSSSCLLVRVREKRRDPGYNVAVGPLWYQNVFLCAWLAHTFAKNRYKLRKVITFRVNFY